jgi:hypothetical protein
MRFKDTKYGDLTGKTCYTYINVAYMGLTSLEGAPEVVIGDFWCDYNGLTSLKGAPRIVKGNFYCDNNRLISLKYSPEIVEGKFWCLHNSFTSIENLEYLPKNIIPKTLVSDFKEEVYRFFRDNNPEILI